MLPLDFSTALDSLKTQSCQHASSFSAILLLPVQMYLSEAALAAAVEEQPSEAPQRMSFPRLQHPCELFRCTLWYLDLIIYDYCYRNCRETFCLVPPTSILWSPAHINTLVTRLRVNNISIRPLGLLPMVMPTSNNLAT